MMQYCRLTECYLGACWKLAVVNQSYQQDELCVKRVPGYEVVKIGTRPIPSDPDVCMCVLTRRFQTRKPIQTSSLHKAIITVVLCDCNT